MAMKGFNVNANTQEGTQAFVDCILLYSKNLEADAVSLDL